MHVFFLCLLRMFILLYLGTLATDRAETGSNGEKMADSAQTSGGSLKSKASRLSSYDMVMFSLTSLLMTLGGRIFCRTFR